MVTPNQVKHEKCFIQIPLKVTTKELLEQSGEDDFYVVICWLRLMVVIPLLTYAPLVW